MEKGKLAPDIRCPCCFSNDLYCLTDGQLRRLTVKEAAEHEVECGRCGHNMRLGDCIVMRLA